MSDELAVQVDFSLDGFGRLALGQLFINVDVYCDFLGCQVSLRTVEEGVQLTVRYLAIHVFDLLSPCIRCGGSGRDDFLLVLGFELDLGVEVGFALAVGR